MATASDSEAPSTTCVVQWPDRTVKFTLSSPLQGGASDTNPSGARPSAFDAATHDDQNHTFLNQMLGETDANPMEANDIESMEHKVSATPGDGRGPHEDPGDPRHNGSQPPAWPTAFPRPIEND
eukprot:12408877-Karenia_brevis.AAC.1